MILVKIIRKSWQVKSVTSVFGLYLFDVVIVGSLMNDPFYLFIFFYDIISIQIRKISCISFLKYDHFN